MFCPLSSGSVGRPLLMLAGCPVKSQSIHTLKGFLGQPMPRVLSSAASSASCMLSASCLQHSNIGIVQDLVDRCLSSNPAMRPSLDDISNALLALRDSLVHNTPHRPQNQSPPQQVSPPQPSPFAQPPSPSPQPGMEVRQAVTRQRINATQYQLPVRRQWVVSSNGLMRQGSTPHATSRQADRIPAEWGRVAQLESKRSAPVTSEVAEAAAAASASATVVESAPMSQVESRSQTDAGETAKAPCLQNLQQVWRTIGFCYMAKQTKSFREDPNGVPAQAETLVPDRLTAVGNEVTGVDGINAGNKQESPKLSLRVKKIFVDQSKQLRQCMVTACK